MSEVRSKAAERCTVFGLVAVGQADTCFPDFIKRGGQRGRITNTPSWGGRTPSPPSRPKQPRSVWQAAAQTYGQYRSAGQPTKNIIKTKISPQAYLLVCKFDLAATGIPSSLSTDRAFVRGLSLEALQSGREMKDRLPAGGTETTTRW